MGDLQPEDVVSVSLSDLAVEQQSVRFAWPVCSLTIGALGFRFLQRCLQRVVLTLDKDEIESGGYELPTFPDVNPSTFALEQYLLVVSFLRDFIKCATGRPSRKNARVWLINASTNNIV